MSESDTPDPTAAKPATPSVVPLFGARIPADHGLSGLGLIMQLGGTLFSAATGVLGLIAVIAMVQLNAATGRYGGGADNTLTLWVLAIAATGVLRSMAHRTAGTRLLYDGGGTPFAAIRRYIGISAIQTVVWTGFYAVKIHAPWEMLIAIAVMLAAWPAALGVVISLPRFKRFEQNLPLAEDKGFEGAAILMLIFGLSGLAFGLVMLYVLMQQSSQFLAQLVGILIVIVMVMLVIRSALHVVAGWRGVSETHMDRAVEAAGRYGDFGVITAFVAAGAMLLIMMTGGADVAGLLAIALVGWLLIAWPLIVRKFFSERQFADLLAGGEAPLHRRAPDLGLTSLGWLLLAFGVLAVSTSLPQALFVGHMPTELMRGGDNPLGMMFVMMQGGMRSPWWAVGMGAVQIWAAIELIRMSDHHRVVASIYGAVATAAAIYVNLPLVDAIKGGGLGRILSPEAGGPIVFGLLAIGLVVPLGTLILVNRKAAPTAQARYRPPVKPAPPIGETKSS